MHDVIIIGAGPAGLSAALWLGRCARATLVFDNGNPRNAAALALHGYLTRDGITPAELRRLGREEVLRYPSVKIEDATVRHALPIGNGFEVGTANGATMTTRTLLLATGRTDTLPDLPDAQTFYGRGLYHCPYCDGWENMDQPVAVLGHTPATTEMAELLLTWSSRVTLCTHGALLAPGAESKRIPAISEKITAMIGDTAGRLTHLEFADGKTIECRALFFSSDCVQKSDLPARLGCRFGPDGSVRCEGHAATNVPGLFVAGNVRGGIHLAIMAAAEGAEAALAINRYLLQHGGAHPAREFSTAGQETVHG